MKKQRIKQKNGYFYAQSRFHLFWFIPTPFWRNYHQIYGDVVLGEVVDVAMFETYDECYNFLNSSEQDEQ